MSNAGKKRSKRKEKDDARELWCPSPTPSEDWGSDADVDFRFEIVGEEVGYNERIIYEVLWHDWQRSDGTSTTWEDPADNPAIQDAVNDWDIKRIANLPDNPDVELWGTIDIVNTRTRLRKQGYEEPTEQEMAGLQAHGDALVRRMEELMAASKEAYPHLFPQNSSSSSKTRASTTAPRRQVQAGPSRVHINAEAGPSDLGPPVASAQLIVQSPPPTAATSRLPAKQPTIPLPLPGVPPHHAAISVWSAVDLVGFISTNPTPGGKRKAAPPPKSASPPQPKRRSLRRRAIIDDEDDDHAFRKCACGTLLPPPDVYQLAVCDTCRNPAKRDSVHQHDHRSTRGTNRGWRSDASIVPGSSIASTSASGHGRELQDWKDGKEVEVSNREGKVPESRKSLRLQVESAWTALAQGCDGEDSAAEITFVNDIDVEEIPPSLHGGAFVYLEDRYDPAGTPSFEFYPDSATPLTDARAFMFCHCKQCDEFDRCCQDTDSDLRFAYTDGLFNFTYGPDDVVVECNPYCSCPTTCGNRVVQRPRRIPIEVFKTERRGWAVRATEDVVRGTVVGVYTGKLIPRAEAEKLQGDRKQYCFDLDYNEEDVPSEKIYSVDAFECGNWTRFINHSCSPNLRVQPVVYDTLPYVRPLPPPVLLVLITFAYSQQRIAFLAFIALQPIPAWTEFTFDYNPKDQRDYEAAAAAARMGAGGKGKASSKPRRPRGAAICVCGAEKCRGWVRT